MQEESRRIYISSAAAPPGAPDDGVYGYAQDEATGALTSLGSPARTEGATFVARDERGTHLYTTRARPDGGVAAFATGDQGVLAALGEVRTGGAGPCHLSVDASSRFLFTAHYASGHLSVHWLTAEGGIGERADLVMPEGSGPDPERQEHAHAHFVWPIRGGALVMLVDLGTDTLWTYAVDAASGRLDLVKANRAPSGSGPRHLRRLGDEALLVTGELGASLMRFEFDAEDGSARYTAQTPASERAGARENAPSELALSEDGERCYVANRGPDTISVFSVSDGALERIAEVDSGGVTPRHLAVVGPYLYVANQDSGNVAVFELGDDGVPRPTGAEVKLRRPYCVCPLP